MARAKTKSAGADLPVPQSDAEAEQMIARLGAMQRDAAEARARHDAQVAALESAHAEIARDNRVQQEALVSGLAIWASANRERLTAGARTKTVQLASGTILWRAGRYAVAHRGLRIDEVVALVRGRVTELLTAAGLAKREGRKAEAQSLSEDAKTLSGMIRIKAELNKEGMLAARDLAATIPGVTVPCGAEEFVVEPLASQIREVA